MVEPSSPVNVRTGQTGARFEALDSWRGLCALSVVLFHLNAATHFHAWLNNGYVAVDFFFVLSGFVIASAYLDRIGDGIALARFMVRRLGRLYPLHVAVLGAYLLLELNRGFHHPQLAFTGERTLPALWADLFLVQGFGAYDLTWNMSAWSISVELWANVAFALAALWAGRRLPWVSLLIVLGLAAASQYPGATFGPVSEAETDILRGVFQCVMEFFLGVAGFALFRLARQKDLCPSGLLEWPALAAALFVFATAPTLPGLVPAAVFFAVVMIFAFEAGPVSRALRRPIPLRLGTVSYSIYLTHSLYTLAAFHLVGFAGRSLALPWVAEADGRDLLVLGGPWIMDMVALACLAATVASSLLTYRYIEDPARLAFNRLSNRIAPTAVPRKITP